MNDNHTVRGLRVFKQLCSFIQLILQRCITESNLQAIHAGQFTDGAYNLMLKPLALSFKCLERALNSDFVPLGAMWFYQDLTYDETLLGLLRLVNVFPKSLLCTYTRVPLAITTLLQAIVDDEAYRPLVSLSSVEMETLLSFVLSIAQDDSVKTETLAGAVAFLAFIASFVKDVKDLSLGSQNSTTSRDLSGQTPPPSMVGLSPSMLPLDNGGGKSVSPAQMPINYSAPGTGRVSGTPGRFNTSSFDDNGSTTNLYGQGITANNRA
uniref:Uncharacterized protein n=1 Tax=Lygus hesperus TaxID=30085 RepID=A0A0A9YZY3_LYGHE